MYDDAEGFKRLLLSQYFYSGLEAAGGVALVTLLFYWGLGTSGALVAAVGGVCVSIVDQPGPPNQKLYQSVAAASLCSTVMLIMTAISGDVWWVGVAVLVVSFVSAMLQSFGRTVLPLSFSILLVVIVSLGSPVVPRAEVLPRTLIFAGGACTYSVYCLVASLLLAFRSKQQALSESLFALAQYLRVKARFYEPGADLDTCYRDLVAQQVVVIERQQAARELLLRRVNSPREVTLVGAFLGGLDVYERIFSSQTDYALLQKKFGSSDAMMFLRDLSVKAAEDLEELAYGAVRGPGHVRAISYKAERFALEYELERLRLAPADSGDEHALAVLRGVVDRVNHGVDQVQELHVISRSALTRAQILDGASFRPFLAPFSLDPKIVLSQLQFDSPVFRFAVRLMLAMGCGYLLAHVLPYATHSYWILLTIAVILRSSFSLTRQRRTDRLIGTLIGGMFTAALLHFTPPDWLQMAVLFVALGTAHVFATIKYRYTAIAASVMALLQVHLLSGVTTFAVGERLIDTLVGGVLAYLFSFVWPSWEKDSLPRLIEGLLRANMRYLDAVLDASTGDVEYRLARKGIFDTLTALTAGFRRMLTEPSTRRLSVREINELITLTHILTAHIAAVRILFTHRSEEISIDNARASLDRSRETIRRSLERAIASLGTDAVAPAVEAAPSGSTVEDGFLTQSQWTPEELLERRLRLIEECAGSIASVVGQIAGQRS